MRAENNSPPKGPLMTNWAPETFVIEALSEDEAVIDACARWRAVRPNVVGLVTRVREWGRLTTGNELFEVRIEAIRDGADR